LISNYFKAADALFQLEKYTGARQEDLFGEDVMLLDREQALKLQQEAVDDRQRTYHDTGWSFVVLSDEDYYNSGYRYKFERDKKVFTKAEKAETGVYLHYTPKTGALTTHLGIAKTDDRLGGNRHEERTKREKVQRIQKDTGEEAGKLETTPWSQALVDDLETLHKAILGRKIGLDTRIAKEIVVLNFMSHHTATIHQQSVRYSEWVEDQLLQSPANKEYLAIVEYYKKLLGIKVQQSLYGIVVNDEIVEQIAELSDSNLDQLLAILVAPAFNVGQPTPFTETLIKRMKVKLTTEWRPGFSFWDRLSKKQIVVELMKLVGAASVGPLHGFVNNLMEGKKDAISRNLAGLFTDVKAFNKIKELRGWDTDKTKEIQKTIEAWLPERWKLKPISSKHSKKS
jgi:hypothetical protein